MTGKINPLSLRLNYFNQRNTSDFYNFYNNSKSYADDFTRNTFLFNFLQNELSLLKFKILQIKIYPEVNQTISVQAVVASNFLKYKSLKFKNIKLLNKRFRSCIFFFMNKTTLKITLRKLRKHFIKYSYSYGLRLHSRYFKKKKLKVLKLKTFFFNIQNIFKTFFCIRNFAKRILHSFSMKPIFNNNYLKLILIFAVMSRFFLYKKPKPFDLNFLDDKTPNLPLPDVFKKSGKNYFTFIKSFETKKNRYLRTFRLLYSFYKTKIRSALTQFFRLKTLAIQHRIQSFLRHALQKNVKLVFKQINLKKKNVLTLKKKSNFPYILPRFLNNKPIKSSYFGVFLRKKTWLQRVFKRKHYFYTFNLLKKSLHFEEYKRLHQKYRNFKKTFFYFLFSLYQGDARMFNHAFSGMFKYLKKHKEFLRFIAQQLKYYHNTPFIKKRVKGILIRLKGKLNGGDRRKTYYIKIGSPIFVQTIDNKISYNLSAIETYAGSFGLRTWFKLS